MGLIFFRVGLRYIQGVGDKFSGGGGLRIFSGGGGGGGLRNFQGGGLRNFRGGG